MRLGPCGLAAAVLVAASACYKALEYNEPPAHTYTAATRQLKTDQGATPVQSAAVSPEFFRVAGINPMLGRFVVEPDALPGRGVAVLSHDLWVQRFRSRPEIIGQPIDLDGQRFVVVGVAPAEFTFPGKTLVWTARTTGTPH